MPKAVHVRRTSRHVATVSTTASKVTRKVDRQRARKGTPNSSRSRALALLQYRNRKLLGVKDARDIRSDRAKLPGSKDGHVSQKDRAKARAKLLISRYGHAKVTELVKAGVTGKLSKYLERKHTKKSFLTVEADIESGWVEVSGATADEDDGDDLGEGAAAISSTGFILFRLPRELRDAVYEQAFTLLNLPTTIVLRSLRHDHIEMLDKADQLEARQFPGVVPAFCYTNHQTYSESVPVFLRSPRKVVIGNTGSLRLFACFLNRVPNRKAFSAVTDLTLEHQARWRNQCIIIPHWNRRQSSRISNSTIEGWYAEHLIVHCLALKHITIKYDYVSFLDLGAYALKNTRFSADLDLLAKKDVIKVLSPSNLFKLTKLKRVDIVCLGGERFARRKGVTKQQVFAHLIEWIQEEKATRGATWELEVKYESSSEDLPDCMGWGAE